MAKFDLDRGASGAAMQALQAIPFGELIGNPLRACVEAQKISAQTTVDFIKEVGLKTVPKLNDQNQPMKDSDGKTIYETQAEYVCFEFIQAGRLVRLNVPLLSIVPIPYISINSIDINFKANITGLGRTLNEASDSEGTKTEENKSENKRVGLIFNRKKNRSNFSSTISSKKDSRGTQESKYSVEYTMDVSLHASQDSLPAGMAKMLEMVGSAMDLCNPDGELEVNSTELVIPKGGSATLEVSYKDPSGLNMSKGFKVSGPAGAVEKTSGDRYVNRYKLTTPGTYTIKTDGKTPAQEIAVEVIQES